MTISRSQESRAWATGVAAPFQDPFHSTSEKCSSSQKILTQEVAEILTSLSWDRPQHLSSWSIPDIQIHETPVRILPSFQELLRSIGQEQAVCKTTRQHGSFASDSSVTSCPPYTGSTAATTPEPSRCEWQARQVRQHAASSQASAHSLISPVSSECHLGRKGGDFQQYTPPPSPSSTLVNSVCSDSMGVEKATAKPAGSSARAFRSQFVCEPSSESAICHPEVLTPPSSRRSSLADCYTQGLVEAATSKLRQEPGQKPNRRRSANKAAKRNNKPYPKAFQDYLIYKRLDRKMSWGAILNDLDADQDRLMAIARVQEGISVATATERMPERTENGLNSVFYRLNINIPSTNEDGSLKFVKKDEGWRMATEWIKVRDAKKQINKDLPGAVERNPERIAAAGYWFIEPNDMAKAFELSRRRDRERLIRGAPTWQEEETEKKHLSKSTGGTHRS